MGKMTETDYQKKMTFAEYYKSLPERQTVKAPKTAFVDRIAEITKKSPKTVRMWIAGVQFPDELTQSVIEEELGISAAHLFPRS